MKELPADSAIAAGHVVEALGAWGDCRVISTLHGGNRNTVLLVERRGVRLVAKTSRRGTEAINWLVPVQEKAKKAGFEVPSFLPSDSGSLLVGGVTLETWIDGVHPSRADLSAWGRRIESFHALTRSWPQRPGSRSTLELVNLDVGGDVDLTAMPPALVEVCRTAWRALAGEPTSAVHGDINFTNLLVTPGGRIALLDWDECRTDVSALDELAVAELTGNRTREPDARFRDALLAWEIAISWRLEPDYARRMARELIPQAQ